MSILLALHAALGVAGIAWGERLGRRGLLLGVFGPLVTIAWLLIRLAGVLDGDMVTETWRWIPALDVDVHLRLDGFAALMVVLVSGIGLLVQAYAARYFPRSTPDLGRLIGLLRQTDLKLLLAMGTISQLGFMTAVFGWGSPEAVTAGCVMRWAPRSSSTPPTTSPRPCWRPACSS